MSDSVSAANVSETRSPSSDTVVAYTILRVSFGANIMLHGVSRILMGHAAFLAYLTHYFEKAPYVPVSMLSSFATVQPWVETVLGLLLVIGLATRFSLIAGALVIMCLVFGTNLAQDWLVSGLQLIYAFLYYSRAPRSKSVFGRCATEAIRRRSMAKYSFRLNLLAVTVESWDPDQPLLYVLRNTLELHGAKFGCGLGQCGACSVLIDGKVARSSFSRDILCVPG